MTRLQPLPYNEWDLEALADAAPGMAKPPPVNVLGLFAHHPALAKAFLAYNNYLTSRASTISRRVGELAILRVAWRRQCRYEWAQHVRIARKAGVTDEEIARIRAGAAPDTTDAAASAADVVADTTGAAAGAADVVADTTGAAAGAADTAGAADVVALIITAVDELDANSRLSDETYLALAAEFDDRQLMDLVFTIGTYGLLAMAFNTFGLELDPGLGDEGFDTTELRTPLTPQKGT